MKSEDLFRSAADWTGQKWIERIDQCASMLFVHGYIPQSARERIAQKLHKAAEANAALSKARGETA